MSVATCTNNKRQLHKAEQHLWLPQAALRRYQVGKSFGGLLFTMVFVGWMCIQWSNVLMRSIAAVLVLVTVWVTVSSLVKDHRRSRGRQLWLEADVLCVTTPQGTTRVWLDDVADARWHQTLARSGLFLYGHEGRILAHLDAAFLANQEEARAFLGWARQRTSLPFKVYWPPTSV